MEHYDKLLERNPSNYETYFKILKAKGVQLFDSRGNVQKLSSSDQEIVKQTVEKYQKSFPRVDAHIRLGMKWLEGDDFAKLLIQFVKPLLIKGAPSVIQDLKEFYSDSAKVEQIESLLMRMLVSMDESRVLHPEDKQE